jgi:N-acetylneuraminate lyase
VLHGFDETLLCGLSLGIKGAVGSTYNYLPGLYNGLWRAYEAGDMEMARRLQQASVDVVKVLNRYRGGVVAGKAIMKMIGIDCGPCRMPLKNLSEAELDAMRGELSAMDFFRLSALKAEAIL